MAKKNIAVATSPKRTIVVDGDSWERLPNFGVKSLPIVGGSSYDLSRALSDRGHEVHNLAYWGDTIAEIAARKEYLPALRGTGATHFLLGGGGNDFLAGGRLRTYLRLYDKDRAPEDYLKPNFYDDLELVLAAYRSVLDDIAERPTLAATRIIVHGYDYAQPMALGWLGIPLDEMGIDDHKPALRSAIIKLLMDAFNIRLKGLAAARPNVTYVDFRGMVGTRWHDELHPRKEVFSELAEHLEAKALR